MQEKTQIQESIELFMEQFYQVEKLTKLYYESDLLSEEQKQDFIKQLENLEQEIHAEKEL